MSAAQDYYQQVLAMGHTPEHALAYTRQHYPDFVPGVSAPVAAPAPTPMSQQPVPAVQPAAQAPIQATPAPMMGASSAVSAPMAAPSAYAPMGVPVPASGPSTMVWAAVGCIVVALLLSIIGQFSHSWIVNNEDEGFTTGLNTVRIDCSFEDTEVDVETCKSFAYAFLSDDYETASQEDTSDADVIQVGRYTEYCDNTYTFTVQLIEAFTTDAEERQSDMANASDARDTCLETPAAGSTGGMVLWVGSLAGLLGAVMLGAGATGRALPANLEKHGHWTAIAAGALMLLAVLVWWVLLPDTELDTSAGMGVWMTVLGGLAGIAAGVMTLLDQK
ncbi:MAG: hypothetical protein ISP84_00765 [Candidatus Poseidonia sp.]|jgi:hypothetical protein|nr:hypothetical protein [Poseidonia sp.]